MVGTQHFRHIANTTEKIPCEAQKDLTAGFVHGVLVEQAWVVTDQFVLLRIIQKVYQGQKRLQHEVIQRFDESLARIGLVVARHFCQSRIREEPFSQKLGETDYIVVVAQGNVLVVYSLQTNA